MKLQDALKLHNEDEVTVTATKQTMRVVEIDVTPREKTPTHRIWVHVMLEDGNWYGYRELS